MFCSIYLLQGGHSLGVLYMFSENLFFPILRLITSKIFICEFYKAGGILRFLNCQVDVSSFVSSRHNMGMSLTRKTWNEIKKCGQVCRHLHFEVGICFYHYVCHYRFVDINISSVDFIGF